ncbi:MAG: 16S rRNA (uracil(1498)-N(3))-methyltransferase [Actinobacteria bacterium]|nr:16S rRNA (uracil(1498)-N(3))-methyltransferase [Actinomycetota bacterium]
MSHPYFFIKPDQATGSEIILSDREDLKHLAGVLRCRSGDIVHFSDDEKFGYRTKTVNIDKNKGLFFIEEKYSLEKSIFEKTLFQCVLKKNAMKFVIQKAAEIGVDRIIPVISSRVVPEITDKSTRLERWQKISDEASKQCKRQFRCLIAETVNIENIDPVPFDLFYVPYEEMSSFGGNTLISRIILLEAPASIGVLVGPEGGLSGDEVARLERKGTIVTGLGKNILRAETASIYFLSVLDFLVKSKKQI